MQGVEKKTAKKPRKQKTCYRLRNKQIYWILETKTAPVTHEYSENKRAFKNSKGNRNKNFYFYSRRTGTLKRANLPQKYNQKTKII